ncbi:hypothetical protein [Maribellus mangrovi]|uniref:hypothetical protein n=1 Tax=Maribellus mangrovi TaxID=3133146 RepID=UPI0030EBEBB2
MQVSQNLKAQIIEQLTIEIEKKILALNQMIIAAKESRDNETKSSVGDKYETGRAMTQMELEKNQAQLSKTEAFRNNLAKIDTKEVNDKVVFGSLVFTTQGAYFISIPFGRINVNETVVFCISPSSPFGKMMAGKTTGDTFTINGKQVRINQIY